MEWSRCIIILLSKSADPTLACLALGILLPHSADGRPCPPASASIASTYAFRTHPSSRSGADHTFGRNRSVRQTTFAFRHRQLLVRIPPPPPSRIAFACLLVASILLTFKLARGSKRSSQYITSPPRSSRVVLIWYYPRTHGCPWNYSLAPKGCSGSLGRRLVDRKLKRSPHAGVNFWSLVKL
ncbi:hypothetical protein BHE74_00043477 [Ensete ventricosum]|nr:hypothetical protein BHE74_00043477 [Ensete ventricosum]